MKPQLMQPGHCYIGRDFALTHIIVKPSSVKNTPQKTGHTLTEFKAGKIKVVANVGTLTTGFDYPELDTIILARPTKSLALYYQMVGRAIRPFKDKDGWVIDLGGSYRRFGSVAELRLECPPGSTRWVITSRGRQLTNVNF